MHENAITGNDGSESTIMWMAKFPPQHWILTSKCFLMSYFTSNLDCGARQQRLPKSKFQMH